VPLMLCASLTCQANDYFFNPVFKTKEAYYSNIRLLQTPPQDNWVTTLSPGVNFGLRHENGELKSNFTWNQLFYTNQTELNISEQLFSMGYQHKGERLQWGTSGYYYHQSYLNTESTGTVLGAVNFTQIMAKQLSLAPTVTYAIDERSSLSLDYSYNKTAYDKNPNVLYYSDYDYHQVSGTFSHLYTENDKLNVTLSGSRYKTVLRDYPTYNEVAQLGWQHSFSQQLVAYVSAGINYSQTKIPNLQDPLLSQAFYLGVFPVLYDPAVGCRQSLIPGNNPCYIDPDTNGLTPIQRYGVEDSNKFGQVFQGSIQKSFERGSVSLVGSRNQTPTSQGLQTSTSLSINNAYTINERWTSGLTATYSNNVITGQQRNLYDRTNITISPNINWKWTPEINVGLSYTFRHQEYKNQSNALGNIVQLQFSYQPQTNYQVK